MMNFDKLMMDIRRNVDNHHQGYFNCIPFLGMERLEKIVPGIEQGTISMIGSGTGNGKSKLARFLYIHTPLLFKRQNLDLNVEVDILYFPLEESPKKVLLSELSRYLYTQMGITASVRELNSIGRHNELPKEVLEKIPQAREHMEEFLRHVHIFETSTASGIYKEAKNFALTKGTYYDRYDQPLSPDELYNVAHGIGEDYKKVAYYKPNNPRQYFILLLDHLSLLQPSQNQTLREAMVEWSSKFALKLRDKFNFTVVNVQQFNVDTEIINTNANGKTITAKMKPNLASFGDARTLIRESSYVFGLFNPYRYRIEDYEGYDIKILKNNFRSLYLMKSRDGEADVQVPFYFDGATDFFKEMPRVDDKEKLNRMYQSVLQIRESRKK